MTSSSYSNNSNNISNNNSKKLLFNRVLLSLLLLCISYAKSANFTNTTTKITTTLMHELYENCSPPAIEEFPKDFFTPSQRREGGVIVHILIAIYMIWTLGIICHEYFVPALEIICETLHLKRDVAGATFMAAGTSSPELFANIIGTFVTKSDLGIGTIVGSAVFNIFGVISLSGLFGRKPLPLDWYPITRDCICYSLTVIMLMIFLYDEQVLWFESLIMLFAYVIYICIMFFNDRIEEWAFKAQRKLRAQIFPFHAPVKPKMYVSTINVASADVVSRKQQQTDEPLEEEPDLSYPWQMPKGAGCFGTIIWILFFPVHLLFFFTIPNVLRGPKFAKLYPIAFLMCIAWIGATCYVSTWMITIIGYTFSIPDSIMGLTFLAIGTSFPEVFSAFVVSRAGHGSMAVSTSIGSNTFDILVGLGLPWFIMAIIQGTNEDNWLIRVESKGLGHVVTSLLVSLVTLYVILLISRFTLSKKLGCVCLLIYLIFVIMSILVEMNVFSQVNLPMCVLDE